MSRALKRTVPAVGTHAPVSTFTSVDLPAPLGPMIDTNSPSSTQRLTPSRAAKLPYSFRTPRASRAHARGLGGARLEQAHEAAREEEDDHGEDGAEDERQYSVNDMTWS